MPLDSSFDGFSFKAANFKCFDKEPQGFDELKPVNVIIGRNNSGKSALLTLIEYLTSPGFNIPTFQWRDRAQPLLVVSGTVTEAVARSVFREDHRGGDLGGDHWSFGAHTIGARVQWSRIDHQKVELLNVKYPEAAVRNFDRLNDGLQAKYGTLLAERMPIPLRGKLFRRLAAERNIVPDPDSKDLSVSSTGDGATNIIQNYINQQSLDHSLVERLLLDALNKVFEPDATFVDIRCHQQGNGGSWEIHLEEDHKGRIALSESGSGLKTVMLVLINLLLVPKSEGKSISNYVFAFEELENNLHPSLLRRLLVFVRDMACSERFPVFLTTHSSAAIDLFSRDAEAQIIHVRHNRKSATATTVKTYVDNKGVLDDLDVRASDILQANCIIWVEGPSDRIYLNRWIALWSNEDLKEGIHYQCVFYGGRLLSHLEARSPDDAGSGISILRLARHACVVIDSDKRAQQTPINETKRRIESEINSIHGMAWITKGREIENYIPNAAFEAWKNWQSLPERDQYMDVFEMLDSQESGLGTRFRDKKPQLAEAITPHITKTNSVLQLDLDDRMNELLRRIRQWNSMRD